jgi:hypothetical protein
LNEDAALTARRSRRAVDALPASARVAIQLPIELHRILRPDLVADGARASAALTRTAACGHRPTGKCAARASLAGRAANSSRLAATTSH